ncbi:MarR Transcriptional regulators [Caulobacteraceae bacterium]|jgi:DNA-binding MarR family transcriptional regulator|eukprot:gene6594-9061_t
MSVQDQEASPVQPVAGSGEPGAQQSSATTSFALNASPSHLLHRAQQAAADLHAAALGANGLTQRQFAVLAVLAEQDGVSQSELVGRTGIDRSTLAEMVARMEAKGLTQRAKSTTDSRANSVTLTETGRAMYQEAMPKLADVDAAVLARLPASKRAGFVELLTRLAMPTVDLDETKATSKKKKEKKKKKKKEKKAK